MKGLVLMMIALVGCVSRPPSMKEQMEAQGYFICDDERLDSHRPIYQSESPGNRALGCRTCGERFDEFGNQGKGFCPGRPSMGK